MANYSNDEIKNHLQGLGYVDASGNATNPEGIYGELTKFNVPPDRLDQAMGWSANTSANWINTNKIQPAIAAKQAAQTPAPAPAPSSPSIMERAASSASAVVNPTGAPAPMPVSRQGQAAQTQWSESMSAAGRLGSMLDDPNSSLMQRAAARGSLSAAARGVRNSTAGIQASQRAMIDAATPIAATDASNYSQTAQANTAQTNAWNSGDAQLQENARQANLGATTQLTTAGMSADLESRKIDTQIAQFAQQLGMSVQQLELDKGKLSQQDRQFYDGLKLEQSKLAQQQAQYETDWTNKFSLEAQASKNRIDLANIDAANKEKLMGIEAAYKQDIAGNETISNAWGTMMQQIGQIQNNADLEDSAKVTLINNAIGSFGAFTSFWKKTTGGDADVSDLLNIKVTSASGTGTGGATNANGTQGPGTSTTPGGGGANGAGIGGISGDDGPNGNDGPN